MILPTVLRDELFLFFRRTGIGHFPHFITHSRDSTAVIYPYNTYTKDDIIRVDFDPRAVFSISQPHYNDHTVCRACLACNIL